MIITVGNQKGGVGKTVTAVTLAHGLARQGLRTLLVDLDPQGHVAFALGLEKAPGLQRLLVGGEPLGAVAIPARENLDIIPGDKTTTNVKNYVTAMNFRESVLRDALHRAPYEVILLDTAPSLDVLHISALVACQWVLVPTRMESMATDGVNELLRSMAEIQQRTGEGKDFAILPTFFDRVTRETFLQLKEIVSIFKGRVWPPIPQDTRVREAPAYKQTLWEYAPNSPAILGYLDKNKRVGGYQAVLGRLLEVIHA